MLEQTILVESKMSDPILKDWVSIKKGGCVTMC